MIAHATDPEIDQTFDDAFLEFLLLQRYLAAREFQRLVRQLRLARGMPSLVQKVRAEIQTHIQKMRAIARQLENANG